MNAKHTAERAAVCLWKQANGEQITCTDVKAHIGSCPDCRGADVAHVWFVINSWRSGIDRSRRGARR
jgi:hypothetical protein